MISSFKDFSRGWSLRFRRGRSSWKSLKNNNTTGGVVCPLLRKSLAPLWGGASPVLVVRATSAKQRSAFHG